MIQGVVDTNVLIETARGRATAIAWLEEQVDLAITTINWLEFMQGASGKAGQAQAMAIMVPFQLVTLTASDQRWSMQQMTRYRLSHAIELKDTLIASVCHRLQVPIYTQNVKDFVPLLGEALVIKPY